MLLNRLFEVKKIAKIPSGSNFAIERALLTGVDSIENRLFEQSVYIKEKDDALRYLIRTSLELQGYDVQEELNVESAQQPVLLIMDCGDSLEELEALRSLKKMTNFVNSKIIVTSSVHDKTTILDTGADLYLPKPYEILDLVRWVEYFIR
jgi:DNA-binding response OmpR family regulator